MSIHQVSQDVIVHYDHQIGRYVALALSDSSPHGWAFRAAPVGRGILVRSPTMGGPWMHWSIDEVHRHAADTSLWPAGCKAAMLEAAAGFPCLKEEAELAEAIAAA